MSTPRPIVVVLLVVVVVLLGVYALGLGGALQGPRPPTRQDLERWFGAGRALRLDELEGSGACSPAPPGTLRVPAGGTCRLVAGSARPWSRREVVLFSGQPLEVVVEPTEEDGGAPTVTGTTKPTAAREKSPRFSIPAAGATVEITCRALGQVKECPLQLIQP